jgi:autophagy-related protein 101
MEPRRRPEYNLDIFADLACVKDVVKGASMALSRPVCFAGFFAADLVRSTPTKRSPLRPEVPVKPWLTQLTAILHTIFFHRYFTSISPLTRDLLDLTLPAIDDVDLETLIEQRTIALVRAIDSTHQQRGRGQLVVQFFEKKRKKAYFFGRAEEDVCWEQWTLDVTLAQPRTETGTLPVHDVMWIPCTDRGKQMC